MEHLRGVGRREDRDEVGPQLGAYVQSNPCTLLLPKELASQGFRNTISKSLNLFTGSLSNSCEAGAVVQSQRWCTFQAPAINISEHLHRQEPL